MLCLVHDIRFPHNCIFKVNIHSYMLLDKSNYYVINAFSH